MPTPVLEAVVAAIRDHGPISFAEYMDLVLYGEGGYYAVPPVGAAGDFVTSPHVHPVFGRLLGAAIDELREALGGPSPFRLEEVGAGDGTLAAQLLDALDRDGIEYVAIERSPGAREALAAIDGLAVRERLAPGDAPHVVIANELLDNLPFRRVRATTEGPREVRVGLGDDRLTEVLAEPDDDLAGAAAGLGPGEETTVPDGALAFVDDLATAIGRGYGLLIDYGDVGAPGGVAHGYRAHRVTEDPLDRPGSADITAGVDFAVVAARAEARGLVAFPTVTQHRALMALGFEAWLRDELARQASFLDERDGLAAVRAWSGRSRATLLADPSFLGRFRWLLLATPGLPAPTWLEAAAGPGSG